MTSPHQGAPHAPSVPSVIEPQGLEQLFAALLRRNYKLVGPTLRDGTITYEEISSPSDLPAGWTDEQQPGMYRLKTRDDNAVFGYAAGPQSWKRILYPSVLRLWQAHRKGGKVEVTVDKPAEEPRYAFIGVRACELQAIGIQDKVFLHGNYVDPNYQLRREHNFIVAVNCTAPAGTCFCASMDSGPRAKGGYDIALTEVILGTEHYFVATAATKFGTEVLGEVECRPANEKQVTAAEAAINAAAENMGRTIDTTDIRQLLNRNFENPRWETTAARCLACANCTMVCPTCFCHNIEDVSDLTGEVAERWRKWDSCFTTAFSYIHGGSVRYSPAARYRQWLTHKLSTWHDQFGTSGCVGCGRCITWCPVGIDITEEVRAIRDKDHSREEV
ncbi:MAG: 4Fe-4S dicluster domain-containing protein [Candidatus Sumerlaeaceae bacterium]|nr:4Fe-4S dicluster domain-containing protein [Candidatus Sumerlaeaceae bacterium]